MSRHVREATGRELTANELSQVAGGWSVDTLAAMGEAQKKGQSQGSGVSEGLSLSYGSVTFSYR